MEGGLTASAGCPVFDPLLPGIPKCGRLFQSRRPIKRVPDFAFSGHGASRSQKNSIAAEKSGVDIVRPEKNPRLRRKKSEDFFTRKSPRPDAKIFLARTAEKIPAPLKSASSQALRDDGSRARRCSCAGRMVRVLKKPRKKIKRNCEKMLTEVTRTLIHNCSELFTTCSQTIYRSCGWKGGILNASSKEESGC